MMHLSPILAFGLAHLPMLGWLVAAAIPLLIHLWSRRNYREIPWAAMGFLMAAVRQQSRRLRIERWLLLMVRTLLVALMVLAVAEPTLERVGRAAVPGGPVHRVLVVDGSYSMDFKSVDKTRFERAKELARKIVENCPRGGEFSLVLMASPPRIVIGNPASETAEVVREIENLPLFHGSADLPATIDMLASLVQSVRQETPRFAQHEIYFLTDLQSVSWMPQWTESSRTAFLQKSEELARIAALTVIDLGQPNADNLAVAGLRWLGSTPSVGHAAFLEVDLRRFGPVIHGQTVELFIDGRRTDQKQIDVPAGGDTSLGFTVRFDSPGDHVVEVRAPGDALEIDNHRYGVASVRDAIRALCVDGRPSGTPFQGAADYLRVALSPQNGRTSEGVIRAEVAGENALAERNLNDYDCVFLCNVAQFTAAEARVLDSYLRHGGNLIFFVGDQVSAERYNQVLGEAAGQGAGVSNQRQETERHRTAVDVGSPAPALLPARLGEVVAQTQFRIDPLDYRHPIVQAFRGRGQAGLLTTPVFKHFKLELPKGSSAATVLALGDGDPLVVEQAVHRGRVVLVATSADASWTAMPLWPSFVPFVQEMAVWCAGASAKRYNVLVGDPLDLTVGAGMAGGDLAVQPPDGRMRRIQASTGSMLTYGDTWLSGIYTVRSDVSPTRTEHFAVNVDPVESDLAVVDQDALRSDVWPDIPFSCDTSWREGGEEDVGGLQYRSTGLPVGILYVVLALLFADTFLGWQYGHHET